MVPLTLYHTHKVWATSLHWFCSFLPLLQVRETSCCREEEKGEGSQHKGLWRPHNRRVSWNISHTLIFEWLTVDIHHKVLLFFCVCVCVLAKPFGYSTTLGKNTALFLFLLVFLSVERFQLNWTDWRLCWINSIARWLESLTRLVGRIFGVPLPSDQWPSDATAKLKHNNN